MDTIDDVLNMLADTTIYYEIITDKVVDGEVTTDQLYRHHLEEFGGYDTNMYDVITDNAKQYLSMVIYPAPNLTDCDYDDQLATDANLRAAFIDNIEMISSCGKIIIPAQFEDCIHTKNDECIDVVFKFAKFESSSALTYYYIFA